MNRLDIIKAVAKVVHNFGRADALDGEALKRLAKSILRIFPADEAAATALAPDLKLLAARPYGGVYVLEQLWAELGLDALLVRGSRAERAIFAMVANRALHPRA